MASSELPDDRRERPRRHRGSTEDGETGVPDEARTERDDQDWLLGAAARHSGARRQSSPGRDVRASSPQYGADVTGRRRLQSDDDVVEPPWPPRGRRRAPDVDDPAAQYGPPVTNGAAAANGAAGANGAATNGVSPHGSVNGAANGTANGTATNGNGHHRAGGYGREGLPSESFRPDGRPGGDGDRNGRRNGNGRTPFDEPVPGRNGRPGYQADGYPADGYAPPENGSRPARHGRPAGGPSRSDAPRSATPFTDAARGSAFPPEGPRADGHAAERGEFEAPRPVRPADGPYRRSGRPAPGGPAPDGVRPDGRYPAREDTPPRDGVPGGPNGHRRNGHAGPPRYDAALDAPGRVRPGPDAGGTGHHRPVGPPAAFTDVPDGDAPVAGNGGPVAPPVRRRRAPEDGRPGGDGLGDAPGAPDPDDVDTTSLPTTRRRRGPRPEDGDPDAGAAGAGREADPDDGSPRTRAGRRRARAYAVPPDVDPGTGPDEVDVGDDDRPATAREDGADRADDTDGPRVGKRSGPVGVGGKISALTSRRRRDADGEKKPTSFWRELPLLIGVALVLTFLIQTFVAKVFVIPSGSMETTLNGCTGCDNDRVLVDKVTYNFTNIAPGDVVVFRGPDSWSNSEYELDQTSNPVVRGLQMAGSLIGFAPPDEKDFVKRVIAVGGQTVSCCDALNQVMVDGQPLDEPYIYYLPEAGPARQIPFGPITVPQGEMWMMGDSRNNSADSRAAGHGPVPEENVIGKVRLIVLPFDRFGGVEAINPQTTAQAAGTGDLPQGTALALGMMGTFPFALGRRRILSTRAESERFLPVARRRKRWRSRR